MDKTPDKKKNRKMTKEEIRHRRRNIVLFTAECVVFLVLLMVIFFLYEVSKLNIQPLDSGKIATNEAVRTADKGTKNSTEAATRDNRPDNSGAIIDINVPDTFEDIETDEEETEPQSETEAWGKYKAPFGDEGYTTIVIYGVDTRKPGVNYLSGTNSDVMILCSINNETHGIRLCSVYRDTLMKFYGREDYGKANAGYGRFDVYESINTLNMNLDLNISQFISVDWTAAIKVIDVLGGAVVELKPEFYEIPLAESPTGKVPYYNGYITELVESTGIESTHIPQEYFDGREFLADGVQAVAYMRLRHTDSDLSRTMRQRSVIAQIFEKAKTSGLGKLLEVYDVASEYVELSLTETELLGLLYNILDYKMEGTWGYPFRLYTGEDFEGRLKYNMITVDLVDNVKRLHEFLYNDPDYVPTDTVYRLDKELREKFNFNDNWEPNFKTGKYSIIDTGRFN